MKICAGIVLYNPDIKRLKKCIDVIKPQTEQLIIIDNASNNISEIQNEFADEKITWILNKENSGIAKALNQLTDYADSEGYEWILTLDQDSICETGLVEKMCAAVNAGKNKNIAMVSPIIIDRGLIDCGRTDNETSENEHLPETEEIKFCITSGCLTNIKAINETGGFNDWLFIYDVDREICIRLLRKGYKIIKSNNAALYHEHGEKTVIKKVFRKKIVYHNYSPISVYYMTRNLVYMLRKYGSEYSPHPTLRWIRLFFAFCVKFIFEHDRIPRLKSFSKGIKDGFKVKINDNQR